jgi:hypothetical protein
VADENSDWDGGAGGFAEEAIAEVLPGREIGDGGPKRITEAVGLSPISSGSQLLLEGLDAESRNLASANGAWSRIDSCRDQPIVPGVQSSGSKRVGRRDEVACIFRTSVQLG